MGGGGGVQRGSSWGGVEQFCIGDLQTSVFQCIILMQCIHEMILLVEVYIR